MRVAVMFVVGALGAGCRDDKLFSLESEPALAPAAPKWQRATVSMIFEKGRHNYSTRIRYFLRLTGPAGEHKSTLEEVFPLEVIAGSFDVPSAEFETLKKTKPLVQLAADGHALVFSRDGGARYQYVALDAGDKPVHCRHLTFAPDASGSPWKSAPTTRDLALAVLRTRRNEGEVHYRSSDGGGSSAFEQDALGAAAYACAHPDDADLRTALRSAATPFRGFANSVVIDAVACPAGLKGD